MLCLILVSVDSSPDSNGFWGKDIKNVSFGSNLPYLKKPIYENIFFILCTLEIPNPLSYEYPLAWGL